MANQSYDIGQINSTNETLCYNLDDSVPLRAGLICLYSIIFFASLLGNSLIIATVHRQPHMRSAVNLFIANMAVSDILQTIFGIPRVITEVIFGRERWLLQGSIGNITCKLVYFIQDTSLSVSIVSLMCITVERFYAVLFPFKYSNLSKHCYKAIVGIWLTGASLHAIYWKVFTLHPTNEKCYQEWPSYHAAMTYFLAVFVGLFFVALVTTIVMYTLIIIKIRQKKVSGERLRRSKEAQERKLLRVVIAITVVFFACFFPQTVLILAAPLYAIPTCHAEALRVVTKVMEQTYSAVNPILCITFSVNYRSGFISALAGIPGCMTSLCRRKTVQLESQGHREPEPNDGEHGGPQENHVETLGTRNVSTL